MKDDTEKKRSKEWFGREEGERHLNESSWYERRKDSRRRKKKREESETKKILRFVRLR